MAVDVVTEIVIARARAEVAAFAADPSNVPAWYENIKSVEWQGAPRVEVGARIAFVAEFLGRRLAYTYEIVEYEPGSRLVMRTADGPFPMETRYEWADAPGGGTRMTLRNRGQPKGFPGLMAPVMAMAMRSANRKDLAQLKRTLEAA
jgi:hypothetical protein